jgi:hypothetical protein
MEKTRMAVCKRIEDIRLEFNTRFPDVNDPPEDEHPMTAVGIVLISAIILGTTDIARLAKFTGYSENFISAIVARTLWATCRSRAIVTVTSLPLAGYRSVVPKEVLALARRSVPGKDRESEPSERLGTTRCGVPLTMTPT